jgi:hypothetical protein
MKNVGGKKPIIRVGLAHKKTLKIVNQLRNEKL